MTTFPIAPPTSPGPNPPPASDSGELVPLEVLLTRAQNRLRPANRITHPLPSEADDRTLTERVEDWIDEHEHAIMTWAMVACAGLSAAAVFCLIMVIVAAVGR